MPSHPSERPPGPPPPDAALPTGRDRFYATRLRQLANLDIEEAEAQRLWHDVARHRQELRERLGRDVGQRVALLDYLQNIRRQIRDPQIIERADLRTIRHQAIIDQLTGLYNRRHFTSALAREEQRCHRYGIRSSLVLLDLDRFKEINDQFGHQAGDEVLRRVGALIAQYVRAPDVACRCGGDEFAILLTNTPIAEAVGVAQRVCQSIATAFRSDPVDGHFLPLTASAGVAAMTQEPDSGDRLVGRADQAMYASKRRGGDGVSQIAR